jgi:dTDP-4-dehydrorhamnose reductase
VIHITTDCVFSGKEGGYDEKSPHDCLDDYGKSKSIGENQDNTNIRTSIIGEELSNKKSLIEWVKSNANKSINGYSNHLWNGVTCLELCIFIDKIISDKLFWKGTKHIHSPNTVSKYELVTMINDIYNLNLSINKVETNENCFRNLSSKYITNISKDIYTQIKEQKEYEILKIC